MGDVLFRAEALRPALAQVDWETFKKPGSHDKHFRSSALQVVSWRRQWWRVGDASRCSDPCGPTFCRIPQPKDGRNKRAQARSLVRATYA